MERRTALSLNLKQVCSEYRVGLWECPQFLFLTMGVIIIAAILTTYVAASRYQEPEIAALMVLALSAALFLIGNLIVRAFEKVAMSSKSKSEFISIMSHQLRSPLSAVKWQLNFLLTGQTNDHRAAAGYLETIAEQNERMIRSVNDLLEVNRIEDGDLILRPSSWSLQALTEKVVKNFQKYAAASNVKISISATGGLPAVFADEERIRRVVEHLLDNAIRYSLKGGQVGISITKDGDKIIWKISDGGTGIPREDQKRIFDKFFRSPNAARYQTSGSGVGLFIAKSIIKLSGGEIGFSSEDSKGSTFWFALPIKQ